MNRRLQQFLAAENLSQSQFAEIVGVARSSITHILSGRNKPGFDFIESMARHFPDLSLEWLISGQGRMYKSNSSPSVPEENTLFPAPDEASDASRPSRPNYSSNDLDKIEQTTINQRDITKIIVFYSDGSYLELP